MRWLRARASWFIPACIALVACDNVAYNEAFCASYKKSFMQSCTVAFETSFVKECANTTPLTGAALAEKTAWCAGMALDTGRESCEGGLAKDGGYKEHKCADVEARGRK